jgi:ParB family chromosome partitioning protein
MKLLETTRLPVSSIVVADRLRAVSEDHVTLLAASMSEQGLMQPIVVTAQARRLLAGAHRLAAAKALGWEDIEVRLVEPESDDPRTECRLFEIDENLARHELSPLDRAAFLAERNACFLALNPDAGHGGDRKGLRHQALRISAWSFNRETEEKTGLRPSTIRRALSTFRGLTPQVRSRLAGTWLAAKEGELYRLSRLDPEAQLKALDLLLAGKAKTVQAAADLVTGRAPSPKAAGATLARAQDVFGRLSRPDQKAFLDWLWEQGHLDTDHRFRVPDAPALAPEGEEAA